MADHSLILVVFMAQPPELPLLKLPSALTVGSNGCYWGTNLLKERPWPGF